MSNEQIDTIKFYQELQDAVANWAAETKPEDCRIVGNKVVGKTFEDLQAAIARVFIEHRLPEAFGTLLIVAATASLIACYGRMDPDQFLAELTEILSIAMSVAYNVERVMVDRNGEADRETPTVH